MINETKSWQFFHLFNGNLWRQCYFAKIQQMSEFRNTVKLKEYVVVYTKHFYLMLIFIAILKQAPLRLLIKRTISKDKNHKASRWKEAGWLQVLISNPIFFPSHCTASQRSSMARKKETHQSVQWKY